MDLVAAGFLLLVGVAAYVWARGIQAETERDTRRQVFDIPDRGQLVMEIPRQQQKITPVGEPGAPGYKASALFNKCLELGIDIDQDSPPLHKVGPRLVTIAVCPGEEFDSTAFAPGLKTSNWQRICRDKRLQLNPETARYVAYLPDRPHYTGIEYQRFTDPHQFEPVLFEDIALSSDIKNKQIPIIIGKTARGSNYVVDLASQRNPHYMIGGVTGAGKTVLMRCFVCSALVMPEKKRPDIALIDVAKTGDEFGIFDGHSALIAPVIITAEQAAEFLRWVVEVSIPERGLNKNRKPLIIYFDEVADLFQHQKLGKIIQGYCESITRIGRSLGVHLVMATQTFDAEVFSQQIRGNTPGRICLRTTLKNQGNQIIPVREFDASKLLGDGDLMTQTLTRCQSAYVGEDFIQQLVDTNRRTGTSTAYQFNVSAEEESSDANNNTDNRNSNDHLKYYEESLNILDKYRLTGISQNILKKELNISSTDTVVRLIKALEIDNKIAGTGTAPKNRRAVLI